MSKLYFITFSNTDYMKCDRIITQAKEFNIFDNIINYNEFMINEFVEKHKEWLNTKSHYGLFIWKPYIILKTLEKMNENDIMVYSDAGMHLNIKGKNKFYEYLEYMKKKDILVFSTSDKYIAQQYVKSDAVMSYNPSFYDELNIMVYAGILIIKKTQKSLSLINDWLKLCENYNFLDNTPSIIYPEKEYFNGNDKDNGLLNLCLSKYKDITHVVETNDTNILINGYQIEHICKDLKNCKFFWDLLEDMPFHCKRDRP